MSVQERLLQCIGVRRRWYRDVCDLYGVSRGEALRLGTRAHGRRPVLPQARLSRRALEADAGHWCDRTFEERWQAHPRESPEQIASFYRELGTWMVFRQAVRHRFSAFRAIAQDVRPNSRFLEYGCGIAPVAFWLGQHRPEWPVTLYLLDVPETEHLLFAHWRFERLRASAGTLAMPVIASAVPKAFHVAAVLETLEHLPNPLAVVRQIVARLPSHGVLWENFRVDPEPGVADLPSARAERPAVYAFLEQTCRLTAGRPHDDPSGGGTRRWLKR